jgi:hypothetical protein
MIMKTKLETKGFSHVVPVQITVSSLLENKRKMATRMTARRIDLLVGSLGLSSEQIRGILSILGEPLEGTDYLHPKEIAQATFSRWLAGKTDIPQFRLAQVVMVIEVMMMEQWHEATKILNFEPDDPFFAIYDAAQRSIDALLEDENLRLMTDKYRVTWRRILREQAKNGPEESARYERYAQHLAAIGISESVGTQKVTAKKSVGISGKALPATA